MKEHIFKLGPFQVEAYDLCDNENVLRIFYKDFQMFALEYLNGDGSVGFEYMPPFRTATLSVGKHRVAMNFPKDILSFLRGEL